MKRIELIALRSSKVLWPQLTELLPPTLESLGLLPDEGAADGKVTVKDLGAAGCLIILEKAALARRVASALARRSGTPLQLFEVVATSGGKQSRYRTTAFRATAAGELLPYEGKELALEDGAAPWGGGSLSEQAVRILDEYAALDEIPERTLEIGFKKRPAGRPSTPRIGTLLATLKKAMSHQAVPQPDGRVELRIDLATGGKQTSFCSAAEHEELEKLLGG